MRGIFRKEALAGLLAAAALGVSSGCGTKPPATPGPGARQGAGRPEGRGVESPPEAVREATEGKTAMAEGVVELTDAKFDEVTGKGVVLVDFWATWCPPCRMQGPIVEKVAQAYAGRAVVVKLDVDSEPASAAKFGIRSIPTLIVFRDGKEAKKLVGLQTEAKLSEALDEALGE